jgi:hypothetical protein
VLLVVLARFDIDPLRGNVEKAVPEQEENPVVGFAQPPRLLDDLIENGLQPRRTRDGAEDARDRTFPLARVLELSGELRSIDVGTSHRAQHKSPEYKGDVRDVFAERGVDRLSSADLAASLNEIEESPWGDIRGRALDARSLARRLRPFSIAPRVVKFDDGTTARG